MKHIKNFIFNHLCLSVTGIILFLWILLMLIFVPFADAHENECWKHMGDEGSGRIYGSTNCGFDIRKWYTNPDWTTYKIVIFAHSDIHILDEEACPNEVSDLPCMQEED